MTILWNVRSWNLGSVKAVVFAAEFRNWTPEGWDLMIDCGPRFPPTPPNLHRPNKHLGGAAAAFHLHEWDKNSSDSSDSSDSGSSSGRFAARHGVTWYAKSLLIGPKCGAHRSASFRVYLARSAYTNAHLEKEILKKKTLGWLGLMVRYTIAGALSAGFFLLGLWKFLTSESIGVRHRLGPEFLGSIELSVLVVKRVVALVLVIYVFLFFLLLLLLLLFSISLPLFHWLSW